MLCPVCGTETHVEANGTKKNVEDAEIYRKRICKNKKCEHVFYTVEFEVEPNESFMNLYNKKYIKGT